MNAYSFIRKEDIPYSEDYRFLVGQVIFILQPFIFRQLGFSLVYPSAPSLARGDGRNFIPCFIVLFNSKFPDLICIRINDVYGTCKARIE